MHVTFDLSEIEDMMLQQARKQLETELETTLHSFGDVCCLYTAVLVSPVQSRVQLFFFPIIIHANAKDTG